jgi:RNA polymerase sigma-70 factor (ECF subfamily)
VTEDPSASVETEDFLRGVERRAYVTARAMIGDADEAMDIVQDTMLRFVRRYARRPADEWRPLFFRILINRVRDSQRRRAVRARVMNWFRDERQPDPVETAPAARDADPVVIVQGREAMAALQRAMEQLPPRQQQAFAMRCLEGMDVATTARAMGCSAGSVKTHYSRALAALRPKLEEYRDD